MKLKSMVLGLLIISLLAVSVHALPIEIVEVELDGTELNDRQGATSLLSLDKGQEDVEVKVELRSTVDVDNVQVYASLSGHDFEDRVSDSTSVFDVSANRTYVKTLTLDLPLRADQDVYELEVAVRSRGDHTQKYYLIELDTARHLVAIKDVVLSPSNGVVAGRALLATVRVQNYGADDEDDVKITFAIPELGISATDYIDSIDQDGDSDDQKSTEELYLRIPPCTRAGTYAAVVTAEFHDAEKTVRKTLDVEILEDDACPIGNDDDDDQGKTIISVGPESQDVTKGQGSVIYPLTITNTGDSQTYTVSVTGGDWGIFKISPTNVATIGDDDTQTLYISAAAKDDASTGMQVFGVSIKAGDKVVKDVTLKANVVGGSAAKDVNLRRALEIGLIVLVVILVILALIIGFSKLKGNDDEGKEEGQSYY